ncbi:hypothetical protein HQQ80_10465 [Microbacteriaceae bacterium VKM Ac-2855]|nr:hypothetical protein [Microbacteriaceae bacterium VKM Ac-2855]
MTSAVPASADARRGWTLATAGFAAVMLAVPVLEAFVQDAFQFGFSMDSGIPTDVFVWLMLRDLAPACALAGIAAVIGLVVIRFLHPPAPSRRVRSDDSGVSDEVEYLA